MCKVEAEHWWRPVERVLIQVGDPIPRVNYMGSLTINFFSNLSQLKSVGGSLMLWREEMLSR